MPTLITRGVASAKAFGLTGTNKGQLYTVLFTSSGTFTTMPGLTTISQLTGQGGASTSDYQVTGDYLPQTVARGPNPGVFVLPLPWSTISQRAEEVVSVLNAGGDNSSYPFIRSEYFVTPDSKWNGFANGGQFFPYWTVAGTWSLQATGSAPIPVTGSIDTYGGFTSPSSYYARGDYILPGSAGANTTALGYTFAGASQLGTYPNATGRAAAVTTYNNVSVTPATEYSIVVGAGGYVQLTFIGP